VSHPADGFYVTGGAVGRNAASYVARQADDELYDGLRRGDICYVLTSRQMGKSSLMVRTADRLRRDGATVVRLDLSGIGLNVSAEQWYYGLLSRIGRQLGLEDELEQFWLDHDKLGPVQRWMEAIRRVVLGRRDGPVVIFIDEIDVVLSLGESFSTDEFFAAIRESFGRRDEDPEWRRLTFCLLGVATPSDLIQDPRTTPFNVGRRVELHDFTPAEAAPLTAGLGRPRAASEALLRRVLFWTGGHPYLTQRICRALAERPDVSGVAGVDQICEELFLAPGSRNRDDNLMFVRKQLFREADRAAILDLYGRVRRGGRVLDEETNHLVSTLRLSGITRAVGGRLRVRNRIYRRVFDRRWVRENLPDAEARRRRRAFRQGALLAGGLALAVLVPLVGVPYDYLDRYYLPHSGDFNGTRKRWGAQEGVGPIAAADLGHRSGRLRIHRRGRVGLVQRVESVDSSGALTLENNRVETYLEFGNMGEIPRDRNAAKICQWEYIRDASGRIVYELARDRRGRFLWGFVYSPAAPGERPVPPAGPGSIVPNRPPDSFAHFVDRTGYPHNLPRSAAGFVGIWRDAQGDEEVVRFFDGGGAPRPNLGGAYGIKVVDDARGLPVQSTILGPDGAPMLDRHGIAGNRAAYDAGGQLLEATTVGLDGRPVVSVLGFARLTARYDAHGNLAENAYFDARGRPTNTRAGGYSRVVSEHDDRGHLTALSHFDARGRPCPDVDGVYRRTIQLGPGGLPLEVRNCGPDGRPTGDRQGVALTRRSYNDRDDAVDFRVFGPDGAPTHVAEGHHRLVSRFDDASNEVEQWFYDEDDRPVGAGRGYSGTLRRFDAHGRMVEDSYVDEARRLVEGAEGYARSRVEYDDRSNPVRVTYWDKDDHPVMTKRGYHELRAAFDGSNNRVEERYFDTGGRPVLANGHARWTARYDLRGWVVEKTFYGLGDAPGKGPEGAYRWVAKYDTRGHQTELALLDPDGKPYAALGPVATVRTEYDERGNVLVQTFLGVDGKSAINPRDGYARIRLEYDERDQVVRRSFDGPDGRPMALAGGVAAVTERHDARGNLVERRYIGLDGRPTAPAGGVATQTARFDDRNLQVEQSVFGLDGKLIDPPRGFARFLVEYDRKRKPLELRYFDARGRPVEVEIVVDRVVAKSPADGMLEPGDVLLEYDGRPIRSSVGLSYLTGRAPDDRPKRRLTVRRGAETRTVSIPPGTMGVQTTTRPLPSTRPVVSAPVSEKDTARAGPAQGH
jgi:hypothetical protein